MSDPAMIEESVSIATGGVSLEGTLALPPDGEIHQAVLLVPNSGPIDRNQNTAQVQLNIFNAVALCLASVGVASFRYDKRGCGNSSGDYDSTGHSDLVSDAAACLRYLQQESPAKGLPTFVLGHGEGTVIAPQLIAANSSVAGQIVLAPFLDNYETVIRRQAEKALKEIAELAGFKGKLIRIFLRISGDQIKKQKKLIDRIRKNKKATFKIRKQVINAKWIREMVELDAVAIHKKIGVPTLAIVGEKDLQSLPSDVEKLKNLLTTPVQTHLFSDLTHIMRPDTQAPSAQHYTALSLLPVDERVLSAIQSWLIQQR